MTTYVYSRTRPGPGDYTFRNARFFVAPEADATRIVVIGDHPRIVAAYVRAGVDVSVQPDGRPVIVPAGVPPIPTSLAAQVSGEVEIPGDWADLPWFSLRALARQVSDEPITTKAQAVAAIEAELRRRANHDPEAISKLSAEADERGLTYPEDPTRADLVAVLSAAE